VADDWSGLQVIDITDSAHPVIVGYCDTPCWAYSVHVAGAYAYVADCSAYSSKLQVIDISDPAHPTIVGSCYIPDFSYDVEVAGSYVYMASYSSGLQVIDITDPVHPAIVGSCDTLDHAYGVYVAGSYAYVADKESGLQVIDITDPNHPAGLGTIDTTGEACSVHIAGAHAYVADYSSGIQVIDITDPAHPVIVGSCDTPGWARGVQLSGTYAYVADGGGGLLILDQWKPLTNITYIDSSTITATVPEGYKPGVYNLHLTNPDGEHIMLHSVFQVCRHYYKDHDQDLYGIGNDYICFDDPEGKYTAIRGEDCNDNAAGIHPAAAEACDGINNNCDGAIDSEGSAGYRIYYKDADQDRHGVEGDSRCLCSPDTLNQYTAVYAGDPNDADPDILGTILTGHLYLPRGWSMISLPLEPEDAKVSTLFPDARAMFRFTSRHELLSGDDSLVTGEGYWIYLP